MFTAKLIRHRHIHEEIDSTNDLVESHIIEREDHFKLVLSHGDEMKAFMKWCVENGGEYNWNRATNKQEGDLPEKAKALFPEDVGWCDLITYYLLHVAGYSFDCIISDVAFKGEVYTKEEMSLMEKAQFGNYDSLIEIPKDAFKTDQP